MIAADDIFRDIFLKYWGNEGLPFLVSCVIEQFDHGLHCLYYQCASNQVTKLIFLLNPYFFPICLMYKCTCTGLKNGNYI